MTEISAFGLDGIRYLDETSDRNLVWMNRFELTRGTVSEIHPNIRRRLAAFGLIVCKNRIRSEWELTAKCRRILRDLEIL